MKILSLKIRIYNFGLLSESQDNIRIMGGNTDARTTFLEHNHSFFHGHLQRTKDF